MSLYLKYRPKTFADLVGQEVIKKTISNAIANNSLSHAYIFFGPRGTGKTSTARLIAKELTCQNNADMLEKAENGTLIDIIEIDAASHTGVDDIRDLREKIKFAPSFASKKVYIIDEVHMLSKGAFNALLKTLEEPPNYAYFILATTEIHKVPETIQSRCQSFSFKRIEKDIITNRLEFICEQETISYEKEALNLIAENSEGGLRNAISFLEQMIAAGNITLNEVEKNLGQVSSQIIENFSQEIMTGNSAKLLQIIQQLIKEGADLKQFVKELIEFLRHLMLKEVKQNLFPEKIIKAIELLQKASNELRSAVIPQLPLEIACIQLGEKLEKKNEQKSTGFFNVFKSERKNEEKNITSNIKKESNINTDSPSPEQTELELTKENLMQKWPLLVEKILSPTLKAALKAATIQEIQNTEINLTVSTDFYFNTLNNAKNRVDVLGVLEDFFGQKMTLNLIKEEKIHLTPSIIEKTDTIKPNKSKNSLVDIANEVFNE